YIQQLTGSKTITIDKRSEIIGKYRVLLSQYLLQNYQGSFIKDPSQGNQIVSEGQSYWQILATDLARIDSKSARIYQADFDKLLQGTQHMISLAKGAGNQGELPAWKVKEQGSQIVLDSDQYGSTANSAADADIDLIRSLIYAQQLVDNGLWIDSGYGDLAQKLTSQAKFLFSDEKGMSVMRPSEDWDDFHFSDYLTPASCIEIASFAKDNSMGEGIVSFWEKAASDSMKLYGEILEDTGEFPAHVQFEVKQDGSIDVTRVHDTVQTYDGIRAPWEIGRYIIACHESTAEQDTAVKALAAGKERDFQFTGQQIMDSAMYLPLAIATGNKEMTTRILRNLDKAKISQDKYFENTLYLMGTIDVFFPRRVEISAPKEALPPTGMLIFSR
ncbi:MAG: glycosyl hydrolase family 8, partial [Candidatus Margulisbacteria bacterium]|nr:glycosyl hydrolase family 8 [Candidatus Margulisiibacteriota bacterium]